ncbi:MAG: DUF4145 domain-containing protein, partial [bacterium]|nr:DUF4145 domain-containing protein [bacterium]
WQKAIDELGEVIHQGQLPSQRLKRELQRHIPDFIPDTEPTNDDNLEENPCTEELQPNERLYPDRLGGREPMPGHDSLPVKTKRIYLETLKALNVQTPILAAIGLRALIESICLEQKTTATNLAKGIDELAQMGLLSDKQAEFLHNHRFMGNEAAHEIVAPKPEHLIAATDIAETLLKTIYILPDMAEQLKPKKAATTPPTAP